MKSFRAFVSEELIKQPSSQLGSNPGGIHTDSETGQKLYIKHYHNADQAKVEALTSKIYNHMGIKTLNPEADGRKVSTEWNPHVKAKGPSFYNKPSEKHAKQLGKLYHAAILTKNWDAVGLEHDNIVHNKSTDDLHAIDHGGAFHFRAQGGHKDYTSDINEKQSLRDPKLPAGQVFNAAFKHHPHAEEHGLNAVKAMDPSKIRGFFRHSGLDNWKDLHKTFEERRKNLINSY